MKLKPCKCGKKPKVVQANINSVFVRAKQAYVVSCRTKNKCSHSDYWFVRDDAIKDWNGELDEK